MKNNFLRSPLPRLLLPLALLLAVIVPLSAHAASFRTAGLLATPRSHHPATTLQDGRVLFAGGDEDGFGNSSAELFDPVSGNWTLTPTMQARRFHHTATLLANGKVLVAGGYDGDNTGVSTAELYDPATGQWTLTGALTTIRYSHTATLLPSHRAVGGAGASLATHHQHHHENTPHD